MLILRSSPASPFGRKVKIVAKLLGLEERIEVVTADTTDPADSLREQNPLGKIPALVLEDGTTLYDSRVIVEYLNTIAGGGIVVPRDGVERFRVLTQQALCDGLMDAALLQVYEGRFRTPETQSTKWLDYQKDKVSRALAVLERDPPRITGPIPHLGTIALACALGYLDLRFEGAWRAAHPGLVEWLDRFAAAVPAFEQTRFRG